MPVHSRTWAVSLFRNTRDREPLMEEYSWSALAESFTSPELRAAKEGPLWSPAVYAPGSTRAKAAVLELTALVLDVDHVTHEAVQEVLARCEGYAYLAHSTWSHEPPDYCVRIILPLARPVPVAEWDRWYPAAVERFASAQADPACRDASRIYYLPSCPLARGPLFWSRVREGRLLEPDEIAQPAEPPAPALLPAPLATATGAGTERLLGDALARARTAGRNDSGFWLAVQLRDNGYSELEAEGLLRRYQQSVGPTNSSGRPEPYTWREAQASLRQAYSVPPREPWATSHRSGNGSLTTTPAPTQGSRGGTPAGAATSPVAVPLTSPPNGNGNGHAPEAAKPAKETQAVRVLRVCREQGMELWHDPAGDHYATVPVEGHRETYPLRSMALRQWMSLRAFEDTGGLSAPGSQALADALNVLGARAAQGDRRDVWLRVGGAPPTLYLDLCRSDWSVVEITPAGWRVTDNAPVCFRRTPGMLPLPVPTEDGSLEDLRELLNVDSEEAWMLLVAWAAMTLRPDAPCPMLQVLGEQGSAKSTLLRMLGRLIDPHVSELRSLPRDQQCLAVAAHNRWMFAADNVSYLEAWASDALCCLVTGGGISYRRLYTDDEETLFTYRRPVGITGIGTVALAGDLQSRTLTVTLPSLPPHLRRPEHELWREFERMWPGVLGALLTHAAAALARLPQTRLTAYPRMADFALWIVAMEESLGWEPGAFLAAYQANQQDTQEAVLESSPIVVPLLKILEELGDWVGTSRELLEKLSFLAEEKETRKRSWPSDPTRLSTLLRRLQPALRDAGIEVEFLPKQHGTRLLRIAPAADPPAVETPADPVERVTEEF